MHIFNFYKLFFSQFFEESYEDLKNTGHYRDSYYGLRNNLQYINSVEIENLFYNFESLNSNDYHKITLNTYSDLSHILIVFDKIFYGKSINLNFEEFVSFVDLATYLTKFQSFSGICKESSMYELINDLLVSVENNINEYNEFDLSTSNKLVKILLVFLREKADIKISNILYENVLSPLSSLVLNSLLINDSNLKNTLKLLRTLLKTGYTVLPLYRDNIIHDVLGLIRNLLDENNLNKLLDGTFEYALEFLIEICNYKEKTIRKMLIEFILREIDSSKINNLLYVNEIDKNSRLFANINCFSMIIKN